jgi:hypothetical protein
VSLGTGYAPFRFRGWPPALGPQRAGVQVNALGFLIMEFDADHALDRPNNGWRFVFAITPGY